MSTQSSEKNVLEFYFLTTKLKEIVRSGWKQWNVPKERLESIAEHVFGTCMLAIAIDSEYNYNLDLNKVLTMLILHETEEILIPDLTPCNNVTREEKLIIGHKAIQEVLSHLNCGDKYIDIIHEFDEHKTPESVFAYMCDKLECDLMSYYYDFQNPCPLSKATDLLKNTPLTVELSDGGKNTMSKCFYIFECQLGRLDANFTEVLDAVEDFLMNK